MKTFATGIGVAVIAFIIAILLGALMALPTYFLWNGLVPSILHLREITFMEAWGLNILCAILFHSASSSSSSK